MLPAAFRLVLDQDPRPLATYAPLRRKPTLGLQAFHSMRPVDLAFGLQLGLPVYRMRRNRGLTECQGTAAKMTWKAPRS